MAVLNLPLIQFILYVLSFEYGELSPQLGILFFEPGNNDGRIDRLVPLDIIFNQSNPLCEFTSRYTLHDVFWFWTHRSYHSRNAISSD